ncbi:hypothetical protein EXIGLDRAFT_735552 [Exidia glandulosa HHB12029]|uniref:Secreted protein n=1 Tax=Exidia glandulosa HHB12029 TaxID=1314781 RepID=A0A165JS28_EXIGL|nr:hypothetical protein EXIGLDRAFT_735552 [Exidia glandulosa HHB12029]
MHLSHCAVVFCAVAATTCGSAAPLRATGASELTVPVRRVLPATSNPVASTVRVRRALTGSRHPHP